MWKIQQFKRKTFRCAGCTEKTNNREHLSLTQNFRIYRIQRIQVERLTVSVVVFVVMVDLIALRGKITDVARREQ